MCFQLDKFKSHYRMQYEIKIDEFELYVISFYSIECHMYTIFYNLCKRNIN